MNVGIDGSVEDTCGDVVNVGVYGRVDDTGGDVVNVGVDGRVDDLAVDSLRSFVSCLSASSSSSFIKKSRASFVV